MNIKLINECTFHATFGAVVSYILMYILKYKYKLNIIELNSILFFIFYVFISVTLSYYTVPLLENFFNVELQSKYKICFWLGLLTFYVINLFVSIYLYMKKKKLFDLIIRIFVKEKYGIDINNKKEK